MITYYHYIVCHPNGELSPMQCPSLYGYFEVAKKLRHSLVFACVPKGKMVYTAGSGTAYGPCYVFVDWERETLYPVSHKPANDIDAYRLWRDEVPQSQITDLTLSQLRNV